MNKYLITLAELTLALGVSVNALAQDTIGDIGGDGAEVTIGEEGVKEGTISKITFGDFGGDGAEVTIGEEGVKEGTISKATAGDIGGDVEATLGEEGGIVNATASDDGNVVINDEGSSSRAARKGRNPQTGKEFFEQNQNDSASIGDITTNEEGIRVITTQDLSATVTNVTIEMNKGDLIEKIAKDSKRQVFQTGTITLSGGRSAGVHTTTMTTAPANAINNTSVINAHAPVNLP